MSSTELEIQQERLKQVATQAFQLDLVAMTALTVLMSGGNTVGRVKLDAAKAWLEHRREMQIAEERLSAKGDEKPSLTIKLMQETGDANVEQIRAHFGDRALSTETPTEGDE